jgi:hypothetical protein
VRRPSTRRCGARGLGETADFFLRESRQQARFARDREKAAVVVRKVLRRAAPAAEIQLLIDAILERLRASKPLRIARGR